MMGNKKLPSVAMTDGMMNRNTITMPCIVNTWLYVSGVMIEPAPSGPLTENSSSRTRRARMPPMENASETATRYMIPMRLWSTVSAHDLIHAHARAMPRTSSAGRGSRR